MNDIVGLLITWVVTAISFFIISKLPIGVEIDTIGKTFISAAVLGLVSAVVKPIMRVIFLVPNVLTLTLFHWLFTFIASVICFGIAAWLVQGFRLRFGIWSAILGAFALSIVNSLLFRILPI